MYGGHELQPICHCVGKCMVRGGRWLYGCMGVWVYGGHELQPICNGVGKCIVGGTEGWETCMNVCLGGGVQPISPRVANAYSGFCSKLMRERGKRMSSFFFLYVSPNFTPCQCSGLLFWVTVRSVLSVILPWVTLTVTHHSLPHSFACRHMHCT